MDESVAAGIKTARLTDSADEALQSFKYEITKGRNDDIYAPRLRPVRHGAEPRRSIRKSMKTLTLGA
jgi:hypothetical protein